MTAEGFGISLPGPLPAELPAPQPRAAGGLMARKRLCWLHPDDVELWLTDYVGVRNEHDQVVPACRECAAQVEPWRVRDASDINVGWPS